MLRKEMRRRTRMRRRVRRRRAEGNNEKEKKKYVHELALSQLFHRPQREFELIHHRHLHEQ